MYILKCYSNIPYKGMVIFIVACNINETDLRTVLSKFHQFVHITTRGIIPCFISLQTFRASTKLSLVPIWSIRLCFPAFAAQLLPVDKKGQVSVKTVEVLTDEATAAFQDHFKCTDWHMFRDAASQENYINLE